MTYIDGEKGELLYRGYPIEQLAAQSDFLDCSFLLLVRRRGGASREGVGRRHGRLARAGAGGSHVARGCQHGRLVRTLTLR